jgi:hypothetical protein
LAFGDFNSAYLDWGTVSGGKILISGIGAKTIGGNAGKFGIYWVDGELVVPEIPAGASGSEISGGGLWLRDGKVHAEGKYSLNGTSTNCVWTDGALVK